MADQVSDQVQDLILDLGQVLVHKLIGHPLPLVSDLKAIQSNTINLGLDHKTCGHLLAWEICKFLKVDVAAIQRAETVLYQQVGSHNSRTTTANLLVKRLHFHPSILAASISMHQASFKSLPQI